MTTEEQREGWRTVAAGWERQRAALWATTRPVSERLVELLAPEPGDSVARARRRLGGHRALSRLSASGPPDG